MCEINRTDYLHDIKIKKYFSTVKTFIWIKLESLIDSFPLLKGFFSNNWKSNSISLISDITIFSLFTRTTEFSQYLITQLFCKHIQILVFELLEHNYHFNLKVCDNTTVVIMRFDYDAIKLIRL